MKLWRIAHPRYALDRSCAGAARYGGRWNPIGTPAFYCATSIALAALEMFVHLAAAPLPPLALAMRVPSAIIPEETNMVINPHHPAYGRVKLAVLRPFTFDARMLSKPRG